MAQYIDIKQTWEDTVFHCPVCGAMVCEHGEMTTKPCAHVLFSWVDQVGEFTNIVPELKPIVEDEDFFHPSDEEFLEKCPDNAVLFALESKSMACGPVYCTVVHAIKFPE